MKFGLGLGEQFLAQVYEIDALRYPPVDQPVALFLSAQRGSTIGSFLSGNFCINGSVQDGNQQQLTVWLRLLQAQQAVMLPAGMYDRNLPVVRKGLIPTLAATAIEQDRFAHLGAEIRFVGISGIMKPAGQQAYGHVDRWQGRYGLPLGVYRRDRLIGYTICHKKLAGGIKAGVACSSLGKAKMNVLGLFDIDQDQVAAKSPVDQEVDEGLTAANVRQGRRIDPFDRRFDREEDVVQLGADPGQDLVAMLDASLFHEAGPTVARLLA